MSGGGGGGGDVPSSDASAASVPLAPGFRFHPTDEELVIYYLKRRILGRSLRVDAIAEIDLYKCEPWDLPARSRIRSRDTEWYFFSALDRKYANKSRTNRATAMGYWKTTGKDREVRHGSRVVGMKKTLVFHAGRAPRGDRTNWVMHEYRLEGEEIADAAVSQDSFVVCRVFQKSGSGPQNGAQYGAPFVEEEWVEEADTLAREDNDGRKEEYLQMNDFSQDQVNQQDTLPRSAPSSIESDDTSHVDDPVGLTEVVKTEPNIIDDMIEYYEHEQNSLELNNNAGESAIVTESSSSPRQNGQYVEMNDLKDVVNLDFPYSDDSATWPLKTCYKQAFVNGIDGGSNLQEILDVEEFFDTMNEDSDSQEPTPLCDNSYLAAKFYSSEQANENMVFYDASNDESANGKDEFVHPNGPLPTPISSSSGFDMVDELLTYFDTTENMLGSLDNLEATDAYLPNLSNFTQQVDATCNGTSMVLEANDQCGASSSAGPSDAIDQLNEKTKDLTPVPDIQVDDSGDKSIRKHLVHMLGSISAPAALAGEFCAGPGKSIAPISAAHSASSSVRVTAGIIQIGGLTFSGNTAKNGDYGFLVSYSIDGNLPTKSLEYDPIAKMNGSAIAAIFHRAPLTVRMHNLLDGTFVENRSTRTFKQNFNEDDYTEVQNATISPGIYPVQEIKG